VRKAASVDALFADLLACGEDVSRLREFLGRPELDESLLVALLRRAVPLRLLELAAATLPWSERPTVLGAVVLNPRAPRPLALRLLASLYWRDLAEAASSPRVQNAVRVRAEAMLKEQLPDLRLGDRIALARIATPPVLAPLLADADAKVVQGALDNPRLREEDLRLALRAVSVSRTLIEQTAASSRWREAYRVRLELVLQPRTPLAIALAQVSSLVPRDLARVAGTAELAPLVQAAASSVLRMRRAPLRT
jgi:hypothetical protein